MINKKRNNFDKNIIISVQPERTYKVFRVNNIEWHNK